MSWLSFVLRMRALDIRKEGRVETQKPAFAGFCELHNLCRLWILNWCPEEDSNFHDRKVTST